MSTRRGFLKTALVGSTVALAPSVLALSTSDGKTDSAAKIIVRGNAFGSRWQLSIPAGMDPTLASEIVQSVIGSVDQSMSPYRADSELTMFNQSHAFTPMEASRDLLTVTRAALGVAEHSNGAFDPTIGPVVNRLGFGPITNLTIDANYKSIEQRSNSLLKRTNNITLDLCGIAKGFALSKISDNLLDAGYDNFLLEIGGEITASGLPSVNSKQPWKVGIELPAQSAAPLYTLALNNDSIATSGIAHHSYALGGKRISHLIDTATKTSVVNNLYSVSVIHRDPMMADAWSTALFVAGEQRGTELANHLGLDALFIALDDSAMRTSKTGNFPASENLL